MRTEQEVEAFKKEATRRHILGCKKCNAGSDPACRCHTRCRREVLAYEACIPRDFWGVKADQVKHNAEPFKRFVQAYAGQLTQALKNGYGLLLLGANGVGKTMFTSYVLMEAIRQRRTSYYTTLPGLDYNIKRGFGNDSLRDRLDLMFTSDFVAIDEVGKEHFKGEGGSWIKTQLERILKQRFDDSMPVLLATNMDFEGLAKAYGPTMASIFNGKYKQVTMMPGDFRANLHEKMEKDMGYVK